MTGDAGPLGHDRAFPELPEWSDKLATLAQQPLVYCPESPRIAERFEAWWNLETLDRPIFVGTANARPARPVTRRLDLVADPDAWFAAKLADLEQMHRVGDALPAIRADFGPVFLGALLGGVLEFGSDTAWTHVMLDEAWSNEPDWALKDDNPWWRRLLALWDRVTSDAPGRYLVCTPDLGGSADVLLNLRGSVGLCMDTVTRPDRVQAAVAAIYPAWRRSYAELHRRALARNAGLLHWLGIWSNRPHHVPACDFCYMIGPREFNELFLPDIAAQSAAVGRAVFHLDGAGATRHVDALLEIPAIRAIQFTPGEGTPSALAWLEMFRRIQARGHALYIVCPCDEVEALCTALAPEGLGLWVCDAPGPEALDAVFGRFCARYGM